MRVQRGYGLLAGIDLTPDGAPGARGHEIQKILFDAGLNSKATGNALLVAPPIVIENKQIDQMASILRSVLSAY